MENQNQIQTDKDIEWINNFFNRLDEALAKNNGVVEWVDEFGKKFTTKLEKELVNLLKENRARLLRIGSQAFKEVLAKTSRKESFEALLVIYSQLNNAELIAKYKEDTIKLALIAKQIQEDTDFWVSLIKQLGMKLLAAAIGSLL